MASLARVRAERLEDTADTSLRVREPVYIYKWWVRALMIGRGLVP